MKDDIDYVKLVEELFSELEKIPFPPGSSNLGGSGDPQSTLEGVGVSGSSGVSKLGVLHAR